MTESAQLVPVDPRSAVPAGKPLRILAFFFLIGSALGSLFGDHFFFFAFSNQFFDGITSDSFKAFFRFLLLDFRLVFFIFFLSSSCWGWIVLPVMFSSFGILCSSFISYMLADGCSIARTAGFSLGLFFLPLCCLFLAGEASLIDSKALFCFGCHRRDLFHPDSLKRFLAIVFLCFVSAFICIFL